MRGEEEKKRIMVKAQERREGGGGWVRYGGVDLVLVTTQWTVYG